MNMYDIIARKRDGKELTKEDIGFFIENYTKGEIPDYQASALLMAIYINGMSEKETYDMTMEMAYSGDVMNLSDVDGVIVDKHSTGGVGDKTTLIITPILASLGCKVAKMSGKGLGFTGGTIDKLHSIKGFNTTLNSENVIANLNNVGACIAGQSGNMTPADKKIYALRDVTATIGNYSLIASSVMSKKIASGADCILLDVKVGSGAFMKDQNQAQTLAESMVKIGKMAGKKISALITNMDVPLGNAVGNWLEVMEAVNVLKGKGPNDITDICLTLSTHLLCLANSEDYEKNYKHVLYSISSGKAYEKFIEIVKAQDGDISCIEEIDNKFKLMQYTEIKAARDGYIGKLDCEKIGRASMILGAGRIELDDEIDYDAGIILNAKTGDYVKNGEVVAKLYTSKLERISEAKKMYLSQLKIQSTVPEVDPLIYSEVR